MRLRLTKIDEFQFLTCLQHQVWGSKTSRFRDWKLGDYLGFIVDKALAGLAEVSGEPFASKQRVWDNGIFPHRIPIKFVHVMLLDKRPPILGQIRDTLTSAWGPKYGWGILNQQLLSESPAKTIVEAIRSQTNDLAEIRANLERYLSEARRQRDVATRKKGVRSNHKTKAEPIDEVATSRPDEESGHLKAQIALIQLGKITGCSVWIAANDRHRLYRGKTLGEGCVKTLRNLGLSEEATRRISLIDVIWIKQNAPVCAFEVETTTSIYSGLLRMSDLLSVVPALNIKLFIVAPRDRQKKVLAELSRPTFHKIGLSEFCRFITTDDLYSLVDKAEGLKGHIQTSAVDSIAIELEEEIESALG